MREYGHPLLLIGLWAALEAATLAWVGILPGNPVYGGTAYEAAILPAVLVVMVALSSRWAWWIAIFVKVSLVLVGLGLALFDEGTAAKGIGLTIISAAALWLIWSGNVELYVLQKRRRRLVPDPGAAS